MLQKGRGSGGVGKLEGMLGTKISPEISCQASHDSSPDPEVNYDPSSLATAWGPGAEFLMSKQ